MTLNQHKTQAMPEIYFKEYTCLQFQCTDDFHIESHKWVTFTLPSQQSKLPSILIDEFGQNNELYVLLWRRSNLGTGLLVKKYDEQKWHSILMNHAPSKIAITGNIIYLFGNQQLAIVPFGKSQAKIIPLHGQLIDLQLCYTHRSIPGVFGIHFNPRQGYLKKEYSSETNVSLWQNIVSKINFTFKQEKQYDFLRILLPNLIGIAYQQQKLIIYDLYKMAEIPALSIKLSLNHQETKHPRIKWHLSSPKQGFTDSISIYIQNEQIIQSYALQINRLDIRVEGEEEADDIRIDRLIGGEIIDWSKTSFQKSTFSFKSQFPICDFIVNQKEFICRSIHPNLGQIPVITRISFDTDVSYKIISQQSIVWFEYFKDLNHEDSIQRFYLPNRYNNHLLTNKQPKNGKRSLYGEDDLLLDVNKWRESNNFVQLLFFNQRVYVSRKESLTTYYQIDKFQYQLEQYKQQDKRQDEGSRKEGILQYSQKQILQSRWGQFSVVQFEEVYKDIMKKLKRYSQLIYQNPATAQKEGEIIADNQLLNANLLKDRIIYYHSIIKYLFEYLNYDQSFVKHTFIIKLVNHFYDQLTHTGQVYQVYGCSILDKLVERSQSQLTPYVQFNTMILFKKLLANVLPDCFIQKNNNSGNGLQTNEYLELLITLLIEDRSNDKKLYLLQKLMSKYLSDNFPIRQNMDNPLVLENISIIICYLLTHPQDSELKLFYRGLLKKTNYNQILEEVGRVMNFIPNQLELLWQIELLERNSNLSSRPLFQDLDHAQKANSGKQGQLKIAKSILSQNTGLQNIQISYKECYAQIVKKCSKIESSSITTFQKEMTSLTQLLKMGTTKEIMRNNYIHILEVQERILVSFITLFNKQFDRFQQTRQNMGFRQDLNRLLNEIENSYIRYKKYFIKLYHPEQQISIHFENSFEMMSVITAKDQQFSSFYISPPIKIRGDICSETSIVIAKRILSLGCILPQIGSRVGINTSRQKINEQLLKSILGKDQINNEEIDILHYFLLKKGEDYLKRILKKIDAKFIPKVTKYFREKREDGKPLMQIIGQIQFQSKLKTDGYKSMSLKSATQLHHD